MNRSASSSQSGSAGWLSAALSLAAVLPLLGLPVYFRTDDVHWLGWAMEHASPFDAFRPSENLFGYYRPLPTLAWWLLYRLFGFEPVGYQLVLAATGVLAMVPLFRIGRRILGREWGGFLAVALFHAGFVTILYFYFWYSALTFALELLLILLALDAFFDGPGRPARPGRFVLLALLAGLAKQPALLVIPAVTIPELWGQPGTFRRRVAWSLGLGLGALTLMMVTPFVAHRPEALGRLGATELMTFAGQRYRFYAEVLLRSPAGPLAAGAAALALLTRAGRRLTPRSGGLLLAVMAGAFGLGRVAPAATLPAWLLLLAMAAFRIPESRGWCLAFVIPLTALLGVDFHVSTYLLEPAVSLTVAILIWLAPALTGSLPAARAPGPVRSSAGLVIGAPVVALILAGLSYGHAGPIVRMRQTRAVFRDSVETVLRDAPAGATIGYLSYEELGESYAEIRRKPLARRVEQHKTMSGAQLARFVRLRGRPDLRVASAQEADTTAGPVWYLAVNAVERGDFAARSDLVELRAWRRGDASAALFQRRK